MRRILVLTIGGSCDPIVNAIKSRNPDFVCFVCSTGPKGSEITVDGGGKPCNKGSDKETAPSIVNQIGLSPDKYCKFVVKDPDNLEECYKCIEEVEKFILEKFGSDAEVIANYTGGTKTMSVALAVFALSRSSWKLEFNKGPRIDLVKIKSGDAPFVVSKQEVFAKQLINTTIRLLLKKHFYSEAVEIMNELTKEVLSQETQEKLLRLYNLCRAFDLWDRFEHNNAKELLTVYAGKELSKDYLIPLKRMLGEIKQSKHEYEYDKLIDILLNAERRKIQQRYDDAVARLYRATEMLAQIRLKTEYEIDTSDVPLEKIPQQLKGDYEANKVNGKIKIGLDKAYKLLAGLGDTIGKLYVENEKRIRNVLTKRNSSILAHGTTPITEKEYSEVEEILVGFIKECLDKLGVKIQLKQFPGDKLIDIVWQLNL